MFKSYLNSMNLTNISILTFIFLFIFTPRFYLPFSVIHLFTIISLYFLLTKYSNTFYFVMILSEIRVFLMLHLALISYTLFINYLSSGDFSSTYWATSTILEVLPCSLFLSILCIKNNFDRYKFYDFILIVGVLQVICVVLAFIFPELRNWMIESSGSPDLLDLYEQIGIFRLYGLTTGYTFSMPLYLGLCVIISYVLGAYRSYKYFLLIPFYIFAIAVNARIALVSLFIAMASVFYLKFKLNPYKQLATVISIIITVFIFAQIVEYEASISSTRNGWVWFFSGIQEVTSLFSGELIEGGLSDLTGKMWFMPQGIDILIGSGENVFGGINRSSDIGYVVNLHYGGLVLSVLLYLPYFWLIIESCRSDIIEKNIHISIALLLVIANFKGNLFMPNEVIKGVLLLIVFSITYTHHQLRKTRKP